MFRRLVVVALIMVLSPVVRAQDATTKPAPATQPADVPAPRTNADGTIQPRFRTMHESFLKRGKEGPIGILFLGDSITEWWAKNGKEIWDARYAKHNAANFGISGDRTQYVLWRIANGELDGIDPKVVVFLLGVNNTGTHTGEEIAAGDVKIVEQIRAKLPNAKIILLAIFPRGPREPSISAAKTDEYMKIIRDANARLAKLDDGKTVRFLDLGPQLAPGGGYPPTDVMPDGVHLSPKGYQIWADGMQPLLDELLASSSKGS